VLCFNYVKSICPLNIIIFNGLGIKIEIISIEGKSIDNLFQRFKGDINLGDEVSRLQE
jgi:hypothetical protein